MLIYRFLDVFFVIFHSGLILFNLFGWIWQKTRIANLVTLGITGASWFLLGIFYGIGYCPLTDWHWQVLIKLGKGNIPNSYVKYLIDRIFGGDINALLVDYFTVILFFLALGMSLFYNWKGYQKRRKSN